MGQVIQIDEARIRDHLGEMVRGTVEETLNAMLDAEADELCGAGRYERSERGRIPGPAATTGRCRPGRRGEAEGPEAAAADL
jgi:transposase-like protein